MSLTFKLTNGDFQKLVLESPHFREMVYLTLTNDSNFSNSLDKLAEEASKPPHPAEDAMLCDVRVWLKAQYDNGKGRHTIIDNFKTWLIGHKQDFQPWRWEYLYNTAGEWIDSQIHNQKPVDQTDGEVNEFDALFEELDKNDDAIDKVYRTKRLDPEEDKLLEGIIYNLKLQGKDHRTLVLRFREWLSDHRYEFSAWRYSLLRENENLFINKYVLNEKAE